MYPDITVVSYKHHLVAPLVTFGTVLIINHFVHIIRGFLCSARRNATYGYGAVISGGTCPGVILKKCHDVVRTKGGVLVQSVIRLPCGHGGIIE